jgi:hypothetical protein
LQNTEKNGLAVELPPEILWLDRRAWGFFAHARKASHEPPAEGKYLGYIIPRMPDHNPLSGIVPKPAGRSEADEAAVVERIEKIEGEVGADAYIKALISAPEVQKRITELENCLQELASVALALSDIDRRPELRAAAEEAAVLLKNRLEVDELARRLKQNVRGQLRRFLEPDASASFADDLRLLKL